MSAFHPLPTFFLQADIGSMTGRTFSIIFGCVIAALGVHIIYSFVSKRRSGRFWWAGRNLYFDADEVGDPVGFRPIVEGNVASGVFDLACFRGDSAWLSVMAAITIIEICWWWLCWKAKIAPAPNIATYVALAWGGMLAALVSRLALAPDRKRASWPVLLVSTVLVGLSASFFLPLKYAIPGQVSFWLDGPLALGERRLFGTDPWLIFDALFGWALVPIDRVYGTWLPVQSVALFSVVLLPASAAKSRALVAYSLAWFLLGSIAAVLFASAGPIFYDRLFGGQHFAALADRLSAGAWMARGESDAMWASFASKRPGLIAGMSAMPSIHVAISFWMWLAARSLAPRLAPAALAYAFFIWMTSVQLGWHYVSDGFAGALGMLGIWWLAQRAFAEDTKPLTELS
jgi:hypothetical protein